MKKRMIIMLTIVGILFGSIFIWKTFSSFMMKRYFATMKEPAMTVSTTTVKKMPWQSEIKAVGSLRAIVGVNVTTELAGMVQKIYFTPGSVVREGDVLVQLNADAEIGQLHSLEAQTELAKITYHRDQLQYKINAISKQTLDSDEWNLKNLQGQTAQQAATVAKKTIRAPFTGRLGISKVNPGQYLNVGDTVSSLQTLNPILIDFYLPQQDLAKLHVGQAVQVVSDTYPSISFKGAVTTIEPLVDKNTRNVLVEASLENPKMQLSPGMFATVQVTTGAPENYLTLPQSAITFNPYGDIAYIVKETGQEGAEHIAKQVFVTTGEMRGNQIQILTGLKEGDMVVTSGQLKLKNNTPVKFNNTIQPSDSSDPVLASR